jgi:hypothetical protein
MNMSFLTTMMPKQAEGKKPETITNIFSVMSDSFTPMAISSPMARGYRIQTFPQGGGSLMTYSPTTRQSSFGETFGTLSGPDANGKQLIADTSVGSSFTVTTGGGDAAAPATEPEAPSEQHAINREQAKAIKDQLKLSGGVDWGVDSLGEDLAVFGLDFTAMNGDREELLQTIRTKAQEMVGELDKNADSLDDYDAQRRVVSGAYARLQNGLASAGGGAAAAAGASASGKRVSVDGVDIDAGFVISVGNVLADPLVLDLKGDGLNLKGADEGVNFDMDGDGEATAMGFIKGDDALLFVDTHGDGLVHDGRQLFGNTDGHANGFEKLRTYDDNADGVIDERDAIYDQLRVWVEKTEDGVSEEGETMSLRDAGVASINVGYENVREDDGTGNLIGQTGGFTRDDGTEGLAADVWFQELR